MIGGVGDDASAKSRRRDRRQLRGARLQHRAGDGVRVSELAADVARLEMRRDRGGIPVRGAVDIRR